MAIKQGRYITADTTGKKEMAIRTTELDKVKDDPFVRKSEVQQTVNNSTLPVSSRAVKLAIDSIDSPSLDGYATEEYVDQRFDSIDLSSYASTTYVEEKLEMVGARIDSTDEKAAEALNNSSESLENANTALASAQNADSKAQESLDSSSEALTNANTALNTAQGVEGKAQEALDNSQEALDTAQTALDTANSRATQEYVDAALEPVFLKSNIAQEWGDSPEKVLSQKFMTESINSVNILDFGAKFDGVTNDTDFWVEAIQYCKSKGKKLLLPKGVSIVDPDVIDPLGVSIEGVQGGYFNRQGSVIQSTSKAGNIFTQKNTGTSNITFSWKNILFRNCHNAWQVGYVVNCKFTNLFLEDATGTFEFGMADVLGTLWNKFLNCQTNTSGRGINITGKNMANSNTFLGCAFRGGESSYLGAVSGYGAIGNTFISTEFFSKGRAVGITLGKTYNTTFINPYFESRDHSIRITNQTRGLKLINPTFAVYEGDGSPNPCYIHHSSGVLDLSIDGGIVFAVDKEVNKGLSLFHTDKPESLMGVDFTAPPVVNVSEGTITSIGYGNLSNVGINRVSGNIRMNKVITGSFISNDMTLSYGGKSLSASFRATVTNLSIDEVRIPFIDEFYNAAHSVLGTGVLRSKNKDSIVTFRLSSGKSSLYMYTQDGRVIQWADLDVGDYITGEANFAVY